MGTDRIIRACFFGLKTAVIEADSPKTRMYLSFLKEHAEKDIEEALHPNWVKSFVSIRNNFERGIIREDLDIGNVEAYELKPKEIPDILEKEVINRLLASPEVLVSALHIKKLRKLVPEMPAAKEDRVDLLAEDEGEVCFPVEVKLGVADHRIVGQVKKYVDFFWKRLSYRFYHTVQGVAIAAGYDKTTMKELKTQGTLVYAYSLKGGGVELTPC